MDKQWTLEMKDNQKRRPKTGAVEEPKKAMRLKREPRNKIRLWRNHRGLTTEEVARRAIDADGKPMTSSLISQVEVGRCAYTENSLERIARALDVEPWMLLAVDPAEQASWLIVGENDPVWQELPTEKRAEASAFLRDMVDTIRDVMQRRWPGMLQPPPPPTINGCGDDLAA